MSTTMRGLYFSSHATTLPLRQLEVKTCLELARSQVPSYEFSVSTTSFQHGLSLFTMKFFSTFSVDSRAFSFWYKIGIVGAALISLYLVGVKSAYSVEYPFLTDPHTIRFFENSKTIVVVQDDHKLENKINKLYGEKAAFFTAKDKSELTEKVTALCNEGKNIIVASEKSLLRRKESLDPLPDLAEKFKYSLYIAKPTKLVPIYAAWLLDEKHSGKLLSNGKAILEDLLEAIPQFSSDFQSFSGKSSIEDMLRYYQLALSNKNGMLHCTAKYLARGTAPGSTKYWNSEIIKTNVGRCYDIDVIGFVWTPRTFGARVKLTKEELELWGNDADTNDADTIVHLDQVAKVDDTPDFAPVKGQGSRAHITLGVAEKVSPEVTGQDLLEIVALEAVKKDWPTYKCEFGWLRNYGQGRWVLYADKNTSSSTLFDGVYGRV